MLLYPVAYAITIAWGKDSTTHFVSGMLCKEFQGCIFPELLPKADRLFCGAATF